MKFLPCGCSRPAPAMRWPQGFVTSAGASRMPKAVDPESGHGLLCQHPALFAHKVLRLVR